MHITVWKLFKKIVKKPSVDCIKLPGVNRSHWIDENIAIFRDSVYKINLIK